MSAASPDALASDASAALAAWRERGAERRDPVRWRFIDALMRRAADQRGALRARLEARAAALIAGYLREPAPMPEAQTAPPRPPSPRDTLAGLVDELARHAGALAIETAGARTGAAPALPAELKTLRQFRGTWSRLAADRRLNQSLAQVPGNAGPLNSHHLVHRALTLMREASPGYLDHFIAQVDALLALEQRGIGAFMPGAPPPAAEAPRPPGPKPGPARRRDTARSRP